MTLAELRQAAADRFRIDDPDYIDVIMATVHTNRGRDEAVWLLIVAAASSLKTELMKPLEGGRDIYFVDRFSTKTLISGRGEEFSMLFDISRGNYAVMCYLDFGSILAMRPDDATTILQDLRQVYDGKFVVKTGNEQGKTAWRGFVGFIGGTTPAIDAMHYQLDSLGPRFVFFRPRDVEDRRSVARRAQMNVGRRREVETGIAEAYATFLREPLPPMQEIEVPDAAMDAIDGMADISTLCRSVVRRDRRSDDILGHSGKEVPGRLAKQLNALGRGLAAVRGRRHVNTDDLETLRRVTMDSMPPLNSLVVRELRDGPRTVDDLSKKALLSRSTMRRRLEELMFLRVVEHVDDDVTWGLTPKVMESVRLAGIRPSYLNGL